jgi:hypothetical protein
MKTLAWILVALVAFGAGWFANDYFKAHPFTSGTATTTPSGGNNTEVCAQVITSAVNPDTGDIKQFPTPCDVPKGWEVIQNDVPGLDLQPQ